MRLGMMRSIPAVLAAALLTNAGLARADALRAPGGGTVRAVVIGVDKYPHLGPGAQLQGAAADATDIKTALAKDGVAADFIPDDKATRARIIEAMNGLVAAAKPGDLAIISYAGHGMQTPEYAAWKGISANGVSEQIALSNFSFSGPGAGEVIVNVEMRAWLSRLDAKGVDTLLIMDSCFGGGMRGFDPRSGEIRTRVVTGSADAAERAKFTGIAMTNKEARADVSAMSHVTFLGGATANSVVPEMPGLDPQSPRLPRGALSYFVARALDGRASVKGVVTRKSLFEYVLQNVPQATNDRQFIDIQPGSEESSVLNKPIFVLGDAAPGPVHETSPSPAIVDERAVRVAIIDGGADDWTKIEKGTAALVEAADPTSADLIWDVGKNEVLASGDLVMQFVSDGSMIGAIADRTWAVRELKALSQSRVLSVGLESEGKLLTQGDQARAGAQDLRGQHLTTFNIAADGTVQMLYPAASGQKGQCPAPDGDHWTCPLEVTPPYGADTVVALATSSEPKEFVAWLRAHNGKRDAAVLPAALTGLLASDTPARLGFAGVFTNSKTK